MKSITVYRLGGNTEVIYNLKEDRYEVKVNDHITGYYRTLDDALNCISY